MKQDSRQGRTFWVAPCKLKSSSFIRLYFCCYSSYINSRPVSGFCNWISTVFVFWKKTKAYAFLFSTGVRTRRLVLQCTQPWIIRPRKRFESFFFKPQKKRRTNDKLNLKNIHSTCLVKLHFRETMYWRWHFQVQYSRRACKTALVRHLVKKSYFSIPHD